MKYLRYALLVIVLLLCVTVALANHDPVTLALWPDTVTAFVGFGYTITLPLFLIVGGAAGLGLLFGLVWEWLRERGQRVEGKKAVRELERARSDQVAPAAPGGTAANPQRDQVLAILDEPSQ
ncbi:MAG: LapA family protein [Rhodobacter sp.]|nr:LapA family protein [Paracoccaceae bacterium]MCC0079183.1 LapA family protein [Rhodobacter sp.]